MTIREYARPTRLVVLLPLLLLLVLPGCASRAKNNASATMRAEVAELAKLYRECLQKYEETPEKAKANCGMYRDALLELSAEGRKEMLPDLLDRLSDRFFL